MFFSTQNSITQIIKIIIIQQTNKRKATTIEEKTYNNQLTLSHLGRCVYYNVLYGVLSNYKRTKF